MDTYRLGLPTAAARRRGIVSIAGLWAQPQVDHFRLRCAELARHRALRRRWIAVRELMVHRIERYDRHRHYGHADLLLE